MKILLVEPCKAPATIGGEDVFLFEPLALEYVAAGVARDHEVRILDLRLGNDLCEVLEEFQPNVVGITSYTVHVNTVKFLFDETKRWNPATLTVVGGHHATVVPEDFHTPSIDLVVTGEGVFAFQEIVRRFEKKRDFEGVAGVARLNGGQLVRADNPTSVDLDDFPLPERSLTLKDRKHYYSEWMQPLASIRTSKGCPYRCSFCALWKLTEGRYLRRKPEKVVEELAGIEEEFVFFADDESLVDAARMQALATMIREAGIRKRYFLYGRSDTIARNAELLELWRDVGLERVFVGLESFRDEDLGHIRKGSNVGDNERAVEILHDLGIEIYASFIVRPEFTRKDFRAFRQYTRQLGIRFASFAVLTPLPGTDLYGEVRTQMITHNYDYFDFIHTLLPTALPLKDFYREFSDLYRKAIPLGKALAFLSKYPWREIPGTLVKSVQIRDRMRKAYMDYEEGGEKLAAGHYG